MSADKQTKKPNDAPSAEETKALDPEEAKRQAYRKKKPVGPIMKPLSNEELDDLVNDPEIKERDHLADAMPKGREADDFDAF
ncbi:MAG: hypothetical protein AABY67_02485 [Nitrospirota bacterium]